MHEFSSSFFKNKSRILRGFNFFELECPIIKSKGRTARTTAVICFSLHLPVLFLAGLAASGMNTYIYTSRWQTGHYNCLFCLELSVYSTCSVLGVK